MICFYLRYVDARRRRHVVHRLRRQRQHQLQGDQGRLRRRRLGRLRHAHLPRPQLPDRHRRHLVWLHLRRLRDALPRHGEQHPPRVRCRRRLRRGQCRRGGRPRRAGDRAHQPERRGAHAHRQVGRRHRQRGPQRLGVDGEVTGLLPGHPRAGGDPATSFSSASRRAP